MANIDNVQLPDGSSYNIVDNTSGFATQNYVDSAVASVTKTTIGLGNVDNTSDLNKPISTATQTALDTLDEDKTDKTDIATVESGTTASRAYSVGELVYVSGTLYRVKTAIASGATFTAGTNVEVTNVSNTLTEQISDKLIDVSEHFSSNSGVKITAFKSKKSNSIVLNFSGNGSYSNAGVVISYDSTVNVVSGLDGNYLGIGNAYQVSANKFFNLMGLFNTTNRTITIIHSENIAANIVEFSINIPLS